MKTPAILSINPGTTTTRCALYALADDDLDLSDEQNIEHDETVMSGFSSIAGQLEFRADRVAAFLKHALGDRQLVACAGRGGMLTPVPAGVIEINEALVDFALYRPVYHHASNLGAPLAYRIAKRHRAQAFIVDPVSVDELAPVARISGLEELPRFSFVHALNIRACGRKLAGELGKPLNDVRAVVAHLGAGFSIATLLGGKLVDSSNRMEVSPFSPERAGGLPPLPLIELCYSGKYEKDELLKKLYGNGGVFGYLGTKDIRKVEEMISAGDQRAKLIYDAMLYQTAKTIGAMAAVAEFKLDGIVLTGGLVNSVALRNAISRRVVNLAPVFVYPGSNECLALAQGAARVLTGGEQPMTWPVRSASELPK